MAALDHVQDKLLEAVGASKVDALLAFNLGIEAGQLIFVACLLVIAHLIHKLHSLRAFPEAIMGQTGNLLAGYMIGGVAAYWTIERVTTFFV